VPGTPDTFEMFFVRHGQSTANAESVWQGQLEFPLSELGCEQARRAGVALAATGAFSGVYTSPLTRASETAGIISEELRAASGFAGEVVSLPGLIERHGGLLQGRPFEQTRAENPELIEKFRSLTEEEAWSLVGAETDSELRIRFGDAMADIWEMQSGEENPRAVVVAHGGVLRAFFREVFGAEVLPGTTRAPNASLTRILWRAPGTEPKLLELASTSHLEGLEK
jgi:broad specificity phosphatase PhoE